ncbi:glycoside hydrolase family 7 protein, partial [Sphaerobolus stellatus SS14]
VGWEASANDVNAGSGACCHELDVWDANSISAAWTRCSGDDCAINSRYSSLCDPDGCDFNSYRQGDKTFYGNSLTVNTSQKVTVVTQFLTDNNSTTGTLSEIRCLYVQKGVVIQNSKDIFPDIAAYDSITDQYCDDQKSLFGDTTSFQDKDGLKAIGGSMARGMVFVMSVWDDHNVNMLWLDSSYPIDADATKPGIDRSSCPTSPGASSEVETNAAFTVTYSNIRYGDIGSSFSDS